MTGYVPKFATFAIAAFVHTAAFAALMDGSYVASAPGVWGSPVETTVVVKQGKIADISFKHNETEGVGSRALDVIARSVVKTQSLAVDVVSGATASSKAALMALSVALQKAGYQASNGVKNTVQTAFGDASTDVVVVGGGPGGMMAAIELSRAGKDVILLEKLGVLGGNGTFTSTYIQAGGTVVQAKHKSTDTTVEGFAKYLSGYPDTDPVMAQTVAPESKVVVDFLVENGADLDRIFKPFAHAPSDGRAPGLEITKTFTKALEKEKVDVRLNARATRILMKDGRAVGVEVTPLSGKPYKVTAKAVILATGGFSASKEMLKQFAPEAAVLGTTNSAGTQGEGHRLAQEVGAKLTDMGKIVLNPSTYNANGTQISFTALRFTSGGIMVNQSGNRFIDDTSNDKTGVTQAMIKATGGTGKAFLIFDQSSVSKLAIIKDYVQKGYVLHDKSLENLAKRLGIDPKGLANTIAKYKTYAESGNDPEFGRKTFGCKFDTLPYYGVKIEPAVHATLGGIAINTKAQALDKNGVPIKGLYAVGQVTDSNLGRHNVNVFVPPSFARIAVREILKETK